MTELLQAWKESIRWLESLGLQGVVLQLAWSLLVVAGVTLVRWWLFRRWVARIGNIKSQYNWRKAISYGSFVVIGLLLSRIWLEGSEQLATFLGLASAGLTLALREPIVNLAGWAYLMSRRHIEVGHRIEVDGVRGDVVDIGLFEFAMLELGNWVGGDQSTGRVVHVPNAVVFQNQIANYSEGMSFIWSELPVVITFESDWKKTKEILTELGNESTAQAQQEAKRDLQQGAGRYMITYTRLTPVVYTSVVDHGVCLTLRFLCKPRQRRQVEERLWEGILTRFDAYENIDLAYPTKRVINLEHSNAAAIEMAEIENT